MIITGLIKYMMDVVGNMAEGIINVNYKAIIEVLVEVYFKIIARRNVMFVRSQITS
jgi:hypothetical protein